MPKTEVTQWICKGRKHVQRSEMRQLFGLFNFSMTFQAWKIWLLNSMCACAPCSYRRCDGKYTKIAMIRYDDVQRANVYSENRACSSSPTFCSERPPCVGVAESLDGAPVVEVVELFASFSLVARNASNSELVAVSLGPSSFICQDAHRHHRA